MELEVLLEGYYKQFSSSHNKVFFNIQEDNLDIGYEPLKGYLKELIHKIVYTYRENEKTKEYDFGQEIFIAKSINKKKVLSYHVGMGLLGSEISTTHGIEWAMVLLLNEIKKRPQAIQFRFLAVGYKLGASSFDFPFKLKKGDKRIYSLYN